MAEAGIIIALDRMRALLRLPAGVALAVDRLRSLVAEAGLKHGLDPTALRAALLPAPQPRELIIARGTPPVICTDGACDLLVAERPPLVPNAQGFLDFHGWSSVVEVHAGQVLARCTTAKTGRAGCDVLGAVQPLVPGRDADPAELAGDGVEVVTGADGGPELHASRSGILARQGDGRLTVLSVLLIDGDVDLGTGSLDTVLPIVIHGDIKHGFSVKSGSDIVVGGLVEDARVSAQGNLEVRGGILPGAQRVKAHGSLTAGSIRGREMKCGELAVRESLRDCLVQCTAGITAKEIAGGALTAADSIRCEVLGAPLADLTRVHAGLDPLTRARLAEADALLRGLERHRALASASRAAAGPPREDPEQVEQGGDLLEVEHAAAVAARAELAAALVHREAAVIEVTRSLRPPVAIRLGDGGERVIDVGGGPAVFRVDDESAAVTGAPMAPA